MTMKATLQAAISSGQINTKQELLERAEALGLTVTRNGRDYIGLLGPDGRRFRIRFAFAGGAFPTRPECSIDTGAVPVIRSRGYWIYALTAHSRNGERKACYIGQTVNLKRRFREHLRRHRPGHASFALFEWAVREQAEVRASVLSWVDGDQSYASRFEGYWLRLAVEAGFEAPDAHNWGRLPQPENPTGQPNRWPAMEVFAASLPLLELVERGITPVELFVASRTPL